MDAEARWRILRAHVEDQVPLAVLARDCGIGVRTLQRWQARYRTGGYTNLDGAPRADTGSHRLPADLITMIEALALSRPRPTIATLHRTVAGIC